MHTNKKTPVLSYLILIILLNSIPLFSQTNLSSKSAIVIVHGAWGGAWAFKKTDSILTTKGYNVYRPTLTGLGEKVHLANPEIGLVTHINDVVNMILFEDLNDIILVGHSYGGMVITGVADKVPERIKQLIYLDAFVPEDGESVVSMQGSRGDWINQMKKEGFLNPFWVKADQLPPKDVPHPVKTFTDKLELQHKQGVKISSTYILTVDPGKKAENDDFAPSAERAKKKGWKMYQMQADHNPQMTMPEKLADMLIQVQ